jgi:hypothetical protein
MQSGAGIAPYISFPLIFSIAAIFFQFISEL